MIGAEYHPIAQQQVPERFQPRWHVGNLVYQGGIPRLKRASLTGAGFIPMRNPPGKRAPAWHSYATPISSVTGAGFAPTRSNFLTRLAGGFSAAFQ